MKPGIKIIIAITITALLAIGIGLPSRYLRDSDRPIEEIESEAFELAESPDTAAAVAATNKVKPLLTLATGEKGKSANEVSIKIDIPAVDQSCLAILQFAPKSSFDPSITENFVLGAVNFLRGTIKTKINSTPIGEVKTFARLKLDCSESPTSAYISYSKTKVFPLQNLGIARSKSKKVTVTQFLKNLVNENLVTAFNNSRKKFIRAPRPAPLASGAPSLLAPLKVKHVTAQGDTILMGLISGSQPMSFKWLLADPNGSYIQELSTVKYETTDSTNVTSMLVRAAKIGILSGHNLKPCVFVTNKEGSAKFCSYDNNPQKTPVATNSPLPTIVATEAAKPTLVATSTPQVIPSQTPAATGTVTPAASITATPVATGSATVSVTPTKSSNLTPTPTQSTPTATATATPNVTASITPSATKTAGPTATSTSIPTATKTAGPTATSTSVPTATKTPLPTATNTTVPTATRTAIPTATSTQIPTNTPAPIPPTATPLPVFTATPLPTRTPLATPTAAVSASKTLAWTANDPSELVVTYRIYKRVGTLDTLIGSISASATPTYVVNGLGSGTYTFVVTAVNGSGLESLPSNAVSTSIA